MNAPMSFSWTRLIVDMKLTGLPAMMACHCAPVHYDASVPSLRLELAEPMAALIDSPAMQGVRAALTGYFGDALQLTIEPGEALKSPANIAQANRVGRFQLAYASIANDEFVRDLMREFGATVMVESVRPAPQAADGRSKPAP